MSRKRRWRSRAPSTFTRADLARLFDNAGLTIGAGALAALCLWLLFWRHHGDVATLAWAALVHLTQAVRLALVLGFRRDAARAQSSAQNAAQNPARWRTLWRVALAANAAAWGLAPLLMLRPLDTSYALLAIVVLLGVAVSELATIASDRLAIALWLLPITLPLAATLLWQRDAVYFALALLSLLFAAVNARAALAQHRLISAAAQARSDNAALVQRLHAQIELTAKASREKSQFLAAASHDLRQPLHALSFFGATLERRLAGSAEQPLIFNMMRSIEALGKSFGAILDISKLDAGAVQPHVQSFPVRDVFRRVQLSFAGQAEEAALQLRFRSAGCIVTSDPQLLERILGNLVQNALRYCRPGSGVLVAARARHNGVSLEVWDSGIGISASELPKIFAEFYQVANLERDRSKGLGMGLAIVKRLAQLLGHELTVRSKPGSGSVFKLWLKRSHPEPMDDFVVAAETVPPAPTEGRGTVLLVDDEESIRTSVGELLREWGYEVIAAATLAEALRAVKAQQGLIDIIVCDLRLRDGMDGLRVVDALRQACASRVPALLITGDTSAEQVLRVHESGHEVLYKPVQPRDMLAALKRLA